MIIDIDSIQETTLKNFYGGKNSILAKMFIDQDNKIMSGSIKPGSSIGYHKHENSSEIVFILSGEGVATFDGTIEIVKANQCHYCPRGHSHGIENQGTEDIVYLAVVSNHA